MAKEKLTLAADPLHKPLTAWWCDDVYPKKYNVSYMFNFGKEGALLKKALQWFRGEYKDDSEQAFKLAANKFLSDQDSYLCNNHHPFSLFLSKPHKWAGKIKSKQKYVEAEEPHHVVRSRIAANWEGVDHEKFIGKVINAAQENPIQYFRGYLQTEGLLKHNNEELWRKTSKALAELVGVKRAKEMWQKRSPLVGAIR